MNEEAMNPIPKLLTDDMNAQLLQDLWNGKYKWLWNRWLHLKLQVLIVCLLFSIKIIRVLMVMMFQKQFCPIQILPQYPTP